MENKKSKKGILADIAYAVGTFFAWFTSFFIYGQFAAISGMGVMNDIVRRVLVTAVFFAFFGLYYWVTRLYMHYRPDKNVAFWIGMLHAVMGLITAFVLIFFAVDSVAAAYLIFGITMYPVMLFLVILVYIMVKIAFRINQSDRLWR